MPSPISAVPSPGTGSPAVGASAVAKQQAIALMQQIRNSLAAGELAEAESLWRQLDKMRVPEKAFGSGEDSPGRVYTAVHQARRKIDAGVIQTAASFSAPLAISSSTDGKGLSLADVHEPIDPTTSDAAAEPPTQNEIMKTLTKAHGDTASQHAVTRTKVRMLVERAKDVIDPPFAIPQQGQVQLHHIEFKCTVYFTETAEVELPSPHKSVDENCKEIIYISRVHLHRVAK